MALHGFYKTLLRGKLQHVHMSATDPADEDDGAEDRTIADWQKRNIIHIAQKEATSLTGTCLSNEQASISKSGDEWAFVVNDDPNDCRTEKRIPGLSFLSAVKLAVNFTNDLCDDDDFTKMGRGSHVDYKIEPALEMVLKASKRENIAIGAELKLPLEFYLPVREPYQGLYMR